MCGPRKMKQKLAYSRFAAIAKNYIQMMYSHSKHKYVELILEYETTHEKSQNQFIYHLFTDFRIHTLFKIL